MQRVVASELQLPGIYRTVTCCTASDVALLTSGRLKVSALHHPGFCYGSLPACYYRPLFLPSRQAMTSNTRRAPTSEGRPAASRRVSSRRCSAWSSACSAARSGSHW